MGSWYEWEADNMLELQAKREKEHMEEMKQSLDWIFDYEACERALGRIEPWATLCELLDSTAQEICEREGEVTFAVQTLDECFGKIFCLWELASNKRR